MKTQEFLERYANGERDFKDANLYYTNLSRANLSRANLEGAILEGAILEDVNLEGAYLEGANLKGANLKGAILEGAYLTRANLTRANLEGAILYGANLYGANGITQFYGVGIENRMIYAYIYQGEIRFQLGCFNGTYEESVNAVTKKYDTDEYRKYLKPYLMALETMKITLESQL